MSPGTCRKKTHHQSFSPELRSHCYQFLVFFQPIGNPLFLTLGFVLIPELTFLLFYFIFVLFYFVSNIFNIMLLVRSKQDVIEQQTTRGQHEATKKHLCFGAASPCPEPCMLDLVIVVWLNIWGVGTILLCFNLL